MDKGKAIKIGIAAVVLIVAAVLIIRALSGGGEPADTPTLGMQSAPGAVSIVPFA